MAFKMNERNEDRTHLLYRYNSYTTNSIRISNEKEAHDNHEKSSVLDKINKKRELNLTPQNGGNQKKERARKKRMKK